MPIKYPSSVVSARVERILEIAQRAAPSHAGRSAIENIRLCAGYAEPGYDDPKSGLIAFGNWNEITEYKDGKSTLIDDYPRRVGDLFEKLGVECEWGDEWDICNDCNKAVRTHGNSFFWRPAFGYISGDLVCQDCILKDPAEFLEECENKTRGITFDIDLEKAGYKCLLADLEAGCHEGQDASAELIAKHLIELGVTRTLFKLDENSQFYFTFSVWVHADEWREDLADDLEKLGVNGPSRSENLRKALQAIPVAQAPGTVVIGNINIDTGEAKVRVLTPE
jgi:hypothetical protein